MARVVGTDLLYGERDRPTVSQEGWELICCMAREVGTDLLYGDMGLY
jgi:hypothetical protein